MAFAGLFVVLVAAVIIVVAVMSGVRSRSLAAAREAGAEARASEARARESAERARHEEAAVERTKAEIAARQPGYTKRAGQLGDKGDSSNTTIGRLGHPPGPTQTRRLG